MACDTVRKYATRRLYGMDNCEDYLTNAKKYLFEQRAYKNSDCNVDTSCFSFAECGESAQAVSITCNINITESSNCSITIIE